MCPTSLRNPALFPNLPGDSDGAKDAAAPAIPTARSTRPSRKPAGCHPSTEMTAPAPCPDAMQDSRTITRQSASNLALAFVLLPKAKRDGMSALYAFCREVDDVADDESIPTEQRRERLAAWRAAIRRACAGEPPPLFGHPRIHTFLATRTPPVACVA